MAPMQIKIEMPRRRAEVTVSKAMAAYNCIEQGVLPCHVLGIFQVQAEEDVQPYFICELDDGRNIYADPTKVRFLDTDKGVLLE